MDLHQCIHPQCLRFLYVAGEYSTGQRRHNQKDRVCSVDPRLVDLVTIDNKIFPENWKLFRRPFDLRQVV